MNEGVEGITGAIVADGVDECRKAVRKQLGAGADWIKFYAGSFVLYLFFFSDKRLTGIYLPGIWWYL